MVMAHGGGTDMCLNQSERCPIKPDRRRTIGHHLYYYANLYETELEQAFRNLPENIETRCECIERADPHLTPPPKPSVQEMIIALTVEFDQ